MPSVVFRYYGGGLVEAGWTYHEGGNPGKAARGQSVDQELNKVRARRRAASQVRRLVMAGRLDYMLTLTYKANMTDRDRAITDLQSFVRIFREKSGVQEWAYLGVMEKQSRGAYHWHLAVRGWQNVALIRSVWLQVVGEGNIDVKGPKKSGRARWGRLKLAYYLSKYITKEEGSDLNKKRYQTSQGLGDDGMILTRITITTRVRSWVQELFEQHGCRVVQEWAGKGMGWVCSWEKVNAYA